MASSSPACVCLLARVPIWEYRAAMLKSMLAFSREMFCWHTGTPVKESYLRKHKNVLRLTLTKPQVVLFSFWLHMHTVALLVIQLLLYFNYLFMMTFVLCLSYFLLSLWYKWIKKLMYKHKNNNVSLTTQSDQLCFLWMSCDVYSLYSGV